MRENKPVLLVLFPLHHKPLSRRAYRGFKPGDEVFGSYISDPQDSGVAVWIHCYGAFAEYACAPESRLVMKPGNVTFEQAASVPLVAFTALQGLRDKGHIQPGQKVLINGAAGGVGTFAVQIARWFGADVTGVCSTRKALSSSQAQLRGNLHPTAQLICCGTVIKPTISQKEVSPLNVIETDRLILRHLTTEDAAFILVLMNDPSWLQFIGDNGVRTLEDACNYIVSGPVAMYARVGFGLYLTALKEDRTPIGICGLIKRDALEDVEIGFAFLPQFWSQGYAYESASAVIAHGRQVLGRQRIVAITSRDNQRSAHLLEKLGLHFERLITLTNDAQEVRLFANAV